MTEKKDVHFGERFYDATLHIIKNFHLKRTQIATEIGIDNATLSRWTGWKTFKPQQHRKQENLRKFGINPLYFREADVEEMLLPGVDNSIEAEIVKAFNETEQAIKEQENDLNEILKLLKRLLENDTKAKKQIEAIQEQLNAIEKKLGKAR